MIKGTLKNGFRFKVDTDEFANDYEFFELLSEIDKATNAYKVVEAINMVLGEKQKNNLVNYLKKKNGKAELTEMIASLQEIFKMIGEKNKKVKN